VSPGDQEPATVEDKPKVIPLAELIWFHVGVAVVNQYTALRKGPWVMAVELTHGAGETFEPGLFHVDVFPRFVEFNDRKRAVCGHRLATAA
jgi:hypothetical protein